MAEVSIDLNMVRVSNEDFLKKAADCAPKRRTDKPSAGGIWKKKNSGGSEGSLRHW